MWILCDTVYRYKKAAARLFAGAAALFVMSYPLIFIVLSTITLDKKRIKIKVKS